MNASGEFRMRLSKGCSALAALIGLTAMTMPARAGEADGRLTVIEENDYFAPHNRDRYYTQGLELSYLSGDLTPDGFWSAPMTGLNDLLPIFDDNANLSRRFNLEAGQQLFTPTNKARFNPDRTDRPYAGWLYGGVGWIQDTDQHMLEHLGLELGTIGPAAQGEQTQNRFHLAIDVAEAQGWKFQLHDEIGGIITYERKWREDLVRAGSWGIDAIPDASFALGNVYDYGAVGGRLRFGRNLHVDYGPGRIGPGPSGTDYFNPDYLAADTDLAFYGFLGTEGRAVGRNIFLDGNSFAPSRSVDKKTIVGDAEAGFAVSYADWARLSYSYLLRSAEFEHQQGTEHFGSLIASIDLPF